MTSSGMPLKCPATSGDCRGPSRRALLRLGTGGMASAAALMTGADLQAQPTPVYGRLTVDVSRLQELGLGRYAGFVRSNLAAVLQRAFAGRLGARGAPALVVRVTSVQLSAWAGSEGGSRRFGGGGGSSTDYMDGEALVVSGREVLRRHPQLSALNASSGGPWYGADNELKRTVALCEHYAAWLARAL
jgi:hypothetical protein